MPATRLAVEAEHIRFKLMDGVAVVVKRPIRASIGCRLRHQLIYVTPFLVRGGLKLYPTDELIKEDGKTYHVFATRKLKYATIAAIDKVIEPVEVLFETPLVAREGYFVFELSDNKEAKLVDGEPTHVMVKFTHSLYARRAEIVIEPKDNVVFSDRTVCRGMSITLAVAFIPVNSVFTVCYSSVRGYKCRKMKASVPPRVLQEFSAEALDSG